MELNKRKYDLLRAKIIANVIDLNRYDDDVLTPPKEVTELWNKSVDFEEWLISMLSRSGEVVLETLDDENILVKNETRAICPACGTKGFGIVDCSCPVSPVAIR